MKINYSTTIYDETLERFVLARDSGEVNSRGITAWTAAKDRVIFVPGAALVRGDGSPVTAWDAENPLPRDDDGDIDVTISAHGDMIPVTIGWERPIETSTFGCESFAGLTLSRDDGSTVVLPTSPVTISGIQVGGLGYPKLPTVEGSTLCTSVEHLVEVLTWVSADCPVDLHCAECRELARALSRGLK